jgi:bacteriocin biosynthesis cyclodehydratase domain-containing protein
MTARDVAPASVRLLALDAFGRAVSDRVTTMAPRSCESIAAASEFGVGDDRLVVIGRGLWTSDPAAHSTYAAADPAWLPVTWEEPWVVAGPFDRAGTHDTCLRCLAQRAVQHDTRSVETEQMRRGYRDDGLPPPPGMLPQHVDFAAAFILRISATRSTREDRLEPGVGPPVLRRALQAHVSTLRVSEVVVIPWDHCERCRTGGGEDLLAAIRSVHADGGG